VSSFYDGRYLAVPKRGILMRLHHRANYCNDNYHTPILVPAPTRQRGDTCTTNQIKNYLYYLA
jgi:hypothetical protein